MTDDHKVLRFTCFCCGSNSLIPLCTLPDKEGRPTDLYLCRVCSAINPNYQIQGKVLEAQVSLHEELWALCEKKQLDSTANELRNLVHFYQNRAYLPPKEANPIIIEVGAGRGCLLEALRREGYKPIGCEPAPKLKALADKQHNFPSGTLELTTAQEFLNSLQKKERVIDVIFMWHVLEHVEKPLDILRGACQILSENGVVICQVPLPESNNLYPEHLFFFSKHLCFYLAEQSGLSVSFMDISINEQFLSFVLCKPSSKWTKITKPELDPLSQWIGDLLNGTQELSKVILQQQQKINAILDEQVKKQTEALGAKHKFFDYGKALKIFRDIWIRKVET